MRIDLNPSATAELKRSGNADQVTSSGQDTARRVAPNAIDEAHLSTGTDAVQQMKVRLNAVPDIRRASVDSLRQAISSGSYQISPGDIADAMLASGTAR